MQISKWPLSKIQEYLLYAIIFLLPLQARWMFRPGELKDAYWEYGTMSIYIIDVLVILSFIFYLSGFFKKELRYQVLGIRYQGVWFLISLLELFIFISIFFAPDVKLAFYGYARFLLALGLFFLVTQIKLNKIKFYWTVVSAGVVQSILAIWQFVMQNVFASKWLGMASQNPAQAGVSVVETELRRWLRAYGSFSHPNILGGFLAITLIINIVLYFKLWEKFGKKGQNVKILLSLIFIIINTFGLMLTFSRAAWLAVIVGLVVLIPWAVEKYKKLGALSIAKVIIVVLLSAASCVLVFHEPFLARLNLDNRLEQISVNERINYNKDASKIIQHNFWFGSGVKNYGLAVYNEVDKSRSVYEYEPAHNVLLLIWAETGFFSIIIFIALLIYLFVKSLNTKNYPAASLIFALTILLIFDHWLFSFAFGMYWFWVIIGLSAININFNKI